MKCVYIVCMYMHVYMYVYTYNIHTYMSLYVCDIQWT